MRPEPSPPRTAAGETGETGATAVEYALMIALIALAIVGAVSAFGLRVGDLFPETIVNALGG